MRSGYQCLEDNAKIAIKITTKKRDKAKAKYQEAQDELEKTIKYWQGRLIAEAAK